MNAHRTPAGDLDEFAEPYLFGSLGIKQAQWVWSFPDGARIGYLWWLTRAAVPERSEPVEVIVANGWGEQFIPCIPGFDALIATTAGNYTDPRELWRFPLAFVLPVVAQ